MTSVWTHGRWTVKPGREDEFVRAWSDLARAAVAEFGVSSPPTLLRDRDHPNVFLGFGAWPDLQTLRRFHDSELVAERALALDDLMTFGEASLLDEVALDG